MVRVPRVCLAGLCLIAGAVQAHASIVTYTYTGLVDYGYDRAGIFGTAESLTGDAFRLVETYDLSKAAYRYGSDGQQSLQFGGLLNQAPGDASLVVTIGSVSRSIRDLSNYIYSGSVTGKHQDFVKDDKGYEYSGFYIQSSQMPADYAQALVLDRANATFIGNYQYFDAVDSSRATYASFDVASLTVSVGPISPVPLPGTLPLFAASLGALGAAGYAVKRRKALS